MAAYASLVSLTHILNPILNPPPSCHFIINTEQIESLQEKVSFLIDFLENYSSKRCREIEDLETKIADATYEAEDIIESNVMNQILAKSVTNNKKSDEIQSVIEKFHIIEKELVKIKYKKGLGDLQHKAPTTTPLTSGKNAIVGFNDHLIQIMGALTTDESNLRIVPIVGMGGIGKTTLATNVYDNPFIVEHFHIRAWITISQEYTIRGIFLALLHQISNTDPNEKEKRDDQLGELLYKELFERKYLIVMDDMWNVEAWDEVKRFLPVNTNGIRVLVTTRLLNLAVDLGSFIPYRMNFLDEERSYDLLCEKVFTQEDNCPVELEKIGKRIARRCGGLPLALVVIGGLLAKSKRTREHWENVEGDVTSVVNYGNDEYFMKILSLSYSHLPVYLKPCFLYVAMFPEDFEIRVSRLVRLWVAEGFIKPTTAKSLEEVAEEYLEDLIDRNLILVRKRGSSGKVKTCNIHDLLRDLCRREARKDKFLRIAKHINNPRTSPCIESERRLSIHPSRWQEVTCKALQSVIHNRSLLSFFTWHSSPIARSFRLLRVLEVVDQYSAIDIKQLINLRYVAFIGCLNLGWDTMSLFWNLQTLVISGNIILPPEMWQMPQLRHVKVSKVYLSNPPPVAQMDDQNIIVLENLQTLSEVVEFVCAETVFKRIPNLKKLRSFYFRRSMGFGPCHLTNLVHLRKLESLRLSCHGTISRSGTSFSDNITFPSSLKKLALHNCMISWDDITSTVASLPNLEVLKLLRRAAKGKEWNLIDQEGFCRLKFLLIEECELEIWEADNTHFPCLETLLVGSLSLREVPIGFAEIPTLQLIKIWGESNSLLTSAMEIKEEREMLGYEGLQVLSID